jgi:hypothetical protein
MLIREPVDAMGPLVAMMDARVDAKVARVCATDSPVAPIRSCADWQVRPLARFDARVVRHRMIVGEMTPTTRECRVRALCVDDGGRLHEIVHLLEGDVSNARYSDRCAERAYRSIAPSLSLRLRSAISASSEGNMNAIPTLTALSCTSSTKGRSLSWYSWNAAA